MRSSYDVLIVGSGVSGLYAALSLDRRMSVLVLSKNKLDISNSALAQGGVAAVLNHEEDTAELHIHDTMVAGGGTNDPRAVRVLVGEGPGNVMHLTELGVDFDSDSQGRLNLTLEGGHSRRRIAHHKDTTGYEIVTKLLDRVRQRDNIDLVDQAALLKLARDEPVFRAGIFSGGRYTQVSAPFCILATGGVGRVFQYTTNSEIATGDGIVMAHKLGARIKNISLVQFHPTAFAGCGGQQRFLISESVRGEGAVLLNCKGERFMPGYDPRGELAPRDVVSNFIKKESQKTQSEKFFLDISFKDPDFVKNRFPAIYKKCLEENVDITRDKIPVFPCQHYLMGGIDVDTNARTTVSGLYAVGECSHTGVHGNNRLASNSLLEALVFSKRAATDIMNQNIPSHVRESAGLSLKSGRDVPGELKKEIQQIVQNSFFITADPDQAKQNLPRISEICEQLEKGGYQDGTELLETSSMAGIAKLILSEVSET